MAFAQLTFRESLRDIEVCLRAQSSKLYHLGIRSVVARNTLANANAVRDWRIYADFAQSLIGIARPLYAQESFGVDLQETVYALDATTIDLCLSVFPWAVFRTEGSRNRQDPHFSDQQFCLASIYDHRTIPLPLASGALLQMDQAASANQSILRNFGKRSQVTNLDSRLRLRSGRHRQKATTSLGQPV
jgi:Domain of unknown function (DUF4372)